MNRNQRFDPNAHYAIEELHPAADTSHVKRKHLDIPYATLSPLQKLDIYRVVLELFEGFEHGDRRFESPVNVKRVLDFLDQHLK